MANKNFLIIQTSFIGDAILASSLVESIYTENCERSIDILIRKGNEGLFANNPKVRSILIWEKQHKKYANLLKLIKRIRKENYDVVINLQRFLATGIITAFSGAKEKIGFNKNPLSSFYTRKISHSIGDGTHEVERNFELIKHLPDVGLNEPRVYPSIEDFEVVETYLRKPFVCIAPTSVWFTKQLPKHKWVELINKIDSSTTIFLIGGKADFKECEEILKMSNHPKVENIAGKLNLLRSAALMKNAKMNYVNDSAPMHLASAMDASTTAFFCSTIPEFGFGPRSKNSQIIQTEEKLTCRPCRLHGKKECPLGHFKCGTSISIDKIA